MIQTENFEINGHALIRTWSDAGMKIRKDGTDQIYDEAIDPVGTGRTYTETDEKVEIIEDTEQFDG